LVSRWVGQGVFSKQLDHTSVLKYVCQKWKLPNLTERASQAKDFGAAVLRSPRQIPDTPITVPAIARMFGAAAGQAEQESDHQRALRGLCDKIEREALGPIGAADEAAGRFRAQAMPGNESQEIKRRSLTIAEAIKAKAGRPEQDSGDARD
jgi:phospholipase C